MLHYGSVPEVDLSRWDFRVFGLVEEPVRWTYEEFTALPKVRVQRDIHCVTGWSKLDMDFEGIPFAEVMKHIRPRSEARFVMVHAEQGFTTNLPLEDLLAPDVIFAFRAGGRDLEPEHGWPLRLVVPHLYFWKSAKWVRGLEFKDKDEPGFWEENGYHMRGDPWKSQRFSTSP